MIGLVELSDIKNLRSAPAITVALASAEPSAPESHEEAAAIGADLGRRTSAVHRETRV